MLTALFAFSANVLVGTLTHYRIEENMFICRVCATMPARACGRKLTFHSDLERKFSSCLNCSLSRVLKAFKKNRESLTNLRCLFSGPRKFVKSGILGAKVLESW